MEATRPFFMHYLYIIHSETVDKFYVGVTEDVNRRLFEHNNSERNLFTAKYRPWTLAAVFECENVTVARKAENFIKKQKSKVLIKKIVEGAELTGVLAQLIRVR